MKKYEEHRFREILNFLQKNNENGLLYKNLDLGYFVVYKIKNIKHLYIDLWQTSCEVEFFRHNEPLGFEKFLEAITDPQIRRHFLFHLDLFS